MLISKCTSVPPITVLNIVMSTILHYHANKNYSMSHVPCFYDGIHMCCSDINVTVL
jgi:hypothetical protein